MEESVESNHDLVVAEEGAFDEKDPKALINLLPPSIRDCLEATKNFFLHDMSDESIRKNISHMQEFPLLKKLRQSFWIEYERVIDHGKNRMEMTRIWQGVTDSSGEFYKLMKRPEFAAYVFTRPIQNAVYDREVQSLGRERMLEILSVSPVYKKTMPDGSEVSVVDGKLAKVQFEIFKHADERVQGGTVKRVNVVAEQRSLNVNADFKQTNNKTTVEVTSDATNQALLDQFTNANELIRQLNELRAKTGDIPLTISTTATVLEEDDSE